MTLNPADPKPAAIGELVTVVIVPRERLSLSARTLKLVQDSVPRGVQIILVDGAYPKDVRAEIDRLIDKRPTTLLRFDRYLLPAEARNFALDIVRTPYVAFVDNDIIPRAGWVEELVSAAVAEPEAAMVAPLTLIHVDRGDGPRDYIHHAIGRINYVPYEGKLTFGGEHVMEWSEPNDSRLADLPHYSEDVEFHGILLDTRLLRSLGGFDERLVICDHDDLCLRIHQIGRPIVSCRSSVVAYDQTGEMTAADRAYLAFRWSRRLVEQSCRIFEENWGVAQTYSSEWGVMHRRRMLGRQASPLARKLPEAWFERYATLLGVIATLRSSGLRRLFAGPARTSPVPPPEYPEFLRQELVKYNRSSFPQMPGAAQPFPASGGLARSSRAAAAQPR